MFVAACATDGRPSKAPATAIRPWERTLSDDVRRDIFAHNNWIPVPPIAKTNPYRKVDPAVIDVWHTDATGLYSNVGADLQPVDTVGQTFLRGHQVTDETGYVEFDTIVPGWEIVAAPRPLNVARRTTHVHVKVFHEREVFTTQLFFPDELLDGLYGNVEPYKAHRLMTAPGLSRSYERIRNGQDIFFRESKSQPMTVAHDKGVLVAKATIGVMSQGNRGFTTLFR
jgi:hypothetical protein